MTAIGPIGRISIPHRPALGGPNSSPLAPVASDRFERSNTVHFGNKTAKPINYLRHPIRNPIDSHDLPSFRFLVLDRQSPEEDGQNAYVDGDGQIRIPHCAMVKGIIRRKMRDLAPKAEYQIDTQLVDEQGSQLTRPLLIGTSKYAISYDLTQDNAFLSHALDSIKARHAFYDGVNFSMGYSGFPLNSPGQEMLVDGDHFQEVKPKLLDAICSQEPKETQAAYKQYIALLNQFGGRTPFYTSAGNDGEEKVSLNAFADNVHLVGSHDADGQRSACSASVLPQTLYALGQWTLRPVFENNHLIGLSYGDDGEVDIPAAELDSKIDLTRPLPPNIRKSMNSGLFISGTSFGSPCRMVEDALERWDVISFPESERHLGTHRRPSIKTT